MRRFLPLTLFAAFLGLYLASIDLRAPNVLAHNFLFDADLDRILGDATSRQNETAFGRHPLFALLMAWPASLVARLGISPLASLRFVVAAIAALGIATAFRVFRRILNDDVTALGFTVLLGTSSAVWLLSSVPETFALSAAAIAACFAARDVCVFGKAGSAPRFAAFTLLSALAIGVTVSNAVYVAVAYVVALGWEVPSWRGRAASLAAYAGTTATIFVALSLLQKAFLGAQIPHPTGVVNPLAAAGGDVFLRFSRPLSLPDGARLLRAFLLDDVVAPGCIVDVVPSVTGPNQMLQFGAWSKLGYLAGVAALVALVAAPGRASVGRIVRSRDGVLALSYLAWCLLLHFFYRANGQPLIFTIHAVLPVLVLLAERTASGSGAGRRALVLVTAVVVAGENATFITEVRTALSTQCAHRVGLVCVDWGKEATNLKYTHGLDAHRTSASYFADLGDEAFAEGRYADAARHYQDALAKDPTLTRIEGNYAVALVQTGHDAEAAEHFRRAQAALVGGTTPAVER